MSALPASPTGVASFDHADPISIGWVVGAALLMGIGVFFLTLWLVTFTWLYLGGILPMLAGILMMFDPRAGANAAA